MNIIIKTFVIIALTAFTAACASYTYYRVVEGRIYLLRFGMDYEKHIAWVHDREEYLKRVEELKARKEAEEAAKQEKKEARLREIEAKKAGKK